MCRGRGGGEEFREEKNFEISEVGKKRARGRGFYLQKDVEEEEGK